MFSIYVHPHIASESGNQFSFELQQQDLARFVKVSL